MRESAVGRNGLALLTWLLPFHIVIIAALFGLARVPAGPLRIIAAWKEMFVVAMFGYVVLRSALGRGAHVRVSSIDLLVAGLTAWAVIVLATENSLFLRDLPPQATLYGIRDVVFFTLLYWVGRATPGTADDDRVFRRMYAVLLITSIIAVAELLFVTPQMLVILGVASYVQDFLGAGAFTAANDFGLPSNYWSLIGGHEVRRAGSVYLSSTGFATPFLLLLPAATVWMWDRRPRPSTLLKLGYAVIWLGLLLSITRAVIIACALQVIALTVYRRRPTWTVAAAVTGVAGLVLAFVLVPGIASYAWETVTWQSGSSASHIKDWSRGIAAFLDQPWGHGLGTADQTAVRAGLAPLAMDNLYLKYAVEMGIVGLCLVLGVLVGFGFTGYQLLTRARQEQHRAWGAVVLLTTLGIAFVGMTEMVFNTMVVSYLFFWLAGTAVTLLQREEGAARATDHQSYA